jgi:hypothetical protein
MAQQARSIQAAITPLRMIFWGGLLCVLDFKFNETRNGEGWSFDVLSDAVGVLLILIGVIRLREIGPGPGMARAPSGKLGFAAFAAVLALGKAIHGHFLYRVPDEMTLILTTVSLLSLVGIVGFCTAMQDMCRDWGLDRSRGKWRATAILFGFIYVAPLGLLYVYMAAAQLSGEPFRLNLGPEGMLLIIPLLIPLVMLFSSTSTMVTEIRMQELSSGRDTGAAEARPKPVQGRREWVVDNEPLPPRHPGATDRRV